MHVQYELHCIAHCIHTLHCITLHMSSSAATHDESVGVLVLLGSEAGQHRSSLKKINEFYGKLTNKKSFDIETPDDTDLVKDGAAAIRTLGSSIDTSFVDLKGGTTGQVLSKASATDLDYTWVTPEIGDITAVVAGTGLTGGGTTGSVTLAIDSTVATLTGSQTFTNKTLTAPIINGGLINLTLNAQTGTTYTAVAADSGKLVTLTNASAITLTLPPSVYAVGEQINFVQLGAGQVTFAQGAGVTIVSAGATASAPKIGKQYAAATAICTASNTFLVIGAVA